MARDPVCGIEVAPLRARAVAIIGTRRLYFCSAAHKGEYLADPGRFGDASAVPAPVDKKSSSGAVAAERRGGSGLVEKRGGSGSLAVEKKGASGATSLDAPIHGPARKSPAAATGGAGAEELTVEEPPGGDPALVEGVSPVRRRGGLLFFVALVLVAGAVALYLWRRRHG